MIILISVLVIVSIFCLIYISKYNKLRNKVNSILKDLNKPLKYGYYEMSCQQGDTIDYKAIVYIKELDRYTNGDSKIELDKIELNYGTSNFNTISAENFVRKQFRSIRKTSDITWLESEILIKEQRKEKLSRLKEITK